MKEATGEASMTGVTVALIAVVAAIAAAVVPKMMSGLGNKSCCSSVGGVWSNGGCFVPNNDGTASNTPNTAFDAQCK